MTDEIETEVSGVPPEADASEAKEIVDAGSQELMVNGSEGLMDEAAEREIEDLLPIGVSGAGLSNIRSDQRIVSIDSKPSVQTEADQQMNYLVNLVASLRSKHILCGRLQGSENSSSGEPRGILQYGEFKVLIPSSEMMDIPENMRDVDPYDVMRYMLNKRLGAEIEFVALGIDQEAGLVVGSRKQAMRKRRRQFFFGQDREGNNLLYEGAIAEARVMSAIRAGIFVEIFGVEAYIPATELSYQRVLNCTKQYVAGQRILVKILSLEKNSIDDVRVTLSVKQAKRNPYDSLNTIYIVDNCYIGTVSMVDVHGVFVALDGGVDCLCPYPARGVPVVGSRATVRLYRVDNDMRRLFGDIIHATYALD